MIEEEIDPVKEILNQNKRRPGLPNIISLLMMITSMAWLFSIDWRLFAIVLVLFTAMLIK